MFADYGAINVLNGATIESKAARFGDQKYLDDWPQRYTNAVVLQHPVLISLRGILLIIRSTNDQDRLWVDGWLDLYHFRAWYR